MVTSQLALINSNFELALALRLVTYFEHRPLHHDEIAFGEAEHGVLTLIRGQEPTNLQEYRDSINPPQSHNTISNLSKYTNRAFCTRCHTYHTELATYHSTFLVAACSECCDTDISTVYRELTTPYYNPMHTVVQKVI